MYKIPANTLFAGQKLIYVPECHSTNSLLMELNGQAELPEGAVVITDHQLAGRGQRGNSWEAAPGKNITCSILLKPRSMEAKNQFQLNMALSLAVAESTEAWLDNPVKLKWPNDIIVEEKKIGGILIESTLQGSFIYQSIAGIGLNVNQRSFTFQGASSIVNFTGVEHDLEEVFQRLIAHIEREYLNLRGDSTKGMKERYLSRLYRYRELHDFESNGVKFSGRIDDVDEDGRLCIHSGDQTRRFAFKEVKFI